MLSIIFPCRPLLPSPQINLFLIAKRKTKTKTKNKQKNSNQTENSSELNERLSESSTTAPAASSEDSSSNEVAVNYTISSPLRKTFRASVEKEENNDDEQKISATFTISPPAKSNASAISLLAMRLEKDLELEPEASVTATINVPLINKNIKTDDPSPTSPTAHQRIPPVPQPRSLFDLDNATSIKLADKFQQEARKCDANAIGDGPFTAGVEFPTEPLPPSPIHHTIFGERRASWRAKCDYSSKVNAADLLTHLMLLMAQIGRLNVGEISLVHVLRCSSVPLTFTNRFFLTFY